jgi:uncharacterized protein
MTFLENAPRIARLLPAWGKRRDSAGRTQPERVVLGVRSGVVPSPKPPVRIFVGSELAQYRAERVFFWSVEQVRDPGRVYEIYLMKELLGFDRRGWLTGFTNYRFAIPHFTRGVGRAIYNDADQIYLADPGELFDTDFNGHGFLALSDRDTSVMLVDCARMASVWTLAAAQHERRKTMEERARRAPGLWGPFEALWHARDAEYQPGQSKLIHYTAIHAQPWRPFPQRYAYQRNPVAHVWFDLERSADAASYQVFTAESPSAQYTALLARVRQADELRYKERRAELPRSSLEADGQILGLPELCVATEARTILTCRLGQDGGDQARQRGRRGWEAERIVLGLDFALGPPTKQTTEQFDGVVCTETLAYFPDEDIPWVIEELLRCARRFLYVTVTTHACVKALADQTRLPNQPREYAWWIAQFEAASVRHPEIHWKLIVQTQTMLGASVVRVREGGRRFSGSPTVWILTDDHPGNTTQSLGLANALGWPYKIKQLSFTPLLQLHEVLFGAFGATQLGLDRSRSAALAPPWPDLVIATGWRTEHIARWIHQQSHGQTRLVQLGRKGGRVADLFDLVVSCTYFRLPPHPRRVEITAPLTQVTSEQLIEAAERWRSVFENAAHPRIALLVGGNSSLHCFDVETARRLGEQVRMFAQSVGGSVFATTSRRTGAEAAEALRQALGKSSYVHLWRPGQQENPYLAYLALADVIIVTGESESMLAEAATTGKPLYIYPLPERPLSLWTRCKEWVVARSHPQRLNARGTVRPQKWLEYLCARLIERGIILPQQDLHVLHETLVRRGNARFFGEPLDMANRPMVREIDEVVRRVRQLMEMHGERRGEETGQEDKEQTPSFSVSIAMLCLGLSLFTELSLKVLN